MSDPVSWLTEPYAYAFMQRALIAALLVGLVAPLVGCWIVLRRLAYLTDATSHATLAGVAAAYLAGVSLTLGALGAGLVMAGLMAGLAAHPRLAEDTIIGIVEVALFAAGLLIVSGSGSVSVDLGHVLLGSITTVSADDLRLDLALGLVALAGLAWRFADLRAATFDPVHAALVGVRVGALRTGLLLLLAVVVVVSLQTVGLLMSVAMVVVPAATARLWTRTVGAMSAVAAGVGVACAAFGLTLAFHLGTAPGATIALVCVAALALSFAATLPRRTTRPVAHVAELARPGAPTAGRRRGRLSRRRAS